MRKYGMNLNVKLRKIYNKISEIEHLKDIYNDKVMF